MISRSMMQKTSIDVMNFLVTMVPGKHPIPSRTRQLSPDTPMVLHGKLCGRVGCCQDYEPPEGNLGGFSSLGGFELHRTGVLPLQAGDWNGRGLHREDAKGAKGHEEERPQESFPRHHECSLVGAGLRPALTQRTGHIQYRTLGCLRVSASWR